MSHLPPEHPLFLQRHLEFSKLPLPLPALRLRRRRRPPLRRRRRPPQRLTLGPRPLLRLPGGLRQRRALLLQAGPEVPLAAVQLLADGEVIL